MDRLEAARLQLKEFNLKMAAKYANKKASKKTISELTSEELCAALETLPQELYDQIYSTVFSTPRKEMYIFTPGDTRSVPFPKLLHVSRASRKLFAERYYGNGSRFVFGSHKDGRLGYDYDIVHVRNWLKLLPEEHRALLQRVELFKLWGHTETGKKLWEHMVARNLWNTKYDVFQVVDAIAQHVFWKREGYPEKPRLKPVKKTGKHEDLLRVQQANDAFLNGVQYITGR